MIAWSVQRLDGDDDLLVVGGEFLDALEAAADFARLDQIYRDLEPSDPEPIGYAVEFHDAEDEPDSIVVEYQTVNIWPDGREENCLWERVRVRRWEVG